MDLLVNRANVAVNMQSLDYVFIVYRIQKIF